MKNTSVSVREKLYEIIFEADTPGGKAFDLLLLIFILASVLAVMLESVSGIRARYGELLRAFEWAVTLLFTLEYILRLYCVGRPVKYALSFYGIVDLLAILPTYLSAFVVGAHSLIVIRALRLLRVFRVLKVVQFVVEARQLRRALKASARKIIIFIGAVLTIQLIVGALIYLIEGEENGFTSIPESIYWAIVTMTTVGYGDIAPQTPQGRFLAAAIMILGYGIIAVPTGIVTVEMAGAAGKTGLSTRACDQCGTEGHDPDAHYCRACGAKL